MEEKDEGCRGIPEVSVRSLVLSVGLVLGEVKREYARYRCLISRIARRRSAGHPAMSATTADDSCQLSEAERAHATRSLRTRRSSPLRQTECGTRSPARMEER